MATTCRPGMKKSAAETVLLMRCAAGVPLVQRDPSTSGWRRPPALVRWMAVVCRSGGNRRREGVKRFLCDFQAKLAYRTTYRTSLESSH